MYLLIFFYLRIKAIYMYKDLKKDFLTFHFDSDSDRFCLKYFYLTISYKILFTVFKVILFYL